MWCRFINVDANAWRLSTTNRTGEKELHQFPFNLSLHHSLCASLCPSLSLSLFLSEYLARSLEYVAYNVDFYFYLFVWLSIYFKHVFHVIKFYNLLALLCCTLCVSRYSLELCWRLRGDDGRVNAICFLTILFTYQLCIIMGIYGLGREQCRICVSFVVVVGGFFYYLVCCLFFCRSFVCLTPLAGVQVFDFFACPSECTGALVLFIWSCGGGGSGRCAFVVSYSAHSFTRSLSRAFTLSWQHTRFDYILIHYIWVC